MVFSVCSSAPRDRSGKCCELSLALGRFAAIPGVHIIVARALLDAIVAYLAHYNFRRLVYLGRCSFLDFVAGSCGTIARRCRVRRGAPTGPVRALRCGPKSNLYLHAAGFVRHSGDCRRVEAFRHSAFAVHRRGGDSGSDGGAVAGLALRRRV